MALPSKKKFIQELVALELRKRASLGGKATLRKYGSKHFSRLGKLPKSK